MGDRGNIIVRQKVGTNTDDVWFYTHWAGSEIGEIVQRALSKRQRWDDYSYLARIIFGELVGDDKGATGYGISCQIGDNEHDLLIVDCPAQKVAIVPKSILKDGKLPASYKAENSWSFDDYAAKAETGGVKAVLNRLCADNERLREALTLAQATIERLATQHGPFNSVQGTLDVIASALSATERKAE